MTRRAQPTGHYDNAATTAIARRTQTRSPAVPNNILYGDHPAQQVRPPRPPDFPSRDAHQQRGHQQVGSTIRYDDPAQQFRSRPPRPPDFQPRDAPQRPPASVHQQVGGGSCSSSSSTSFQQHRPPHQHSSHHVARPEKTNSSGGVGGKQDLARASSAGTGFGGFVRNLFGGAKKSDEPEQTIYLDEGDLGASMLVYYLHASEFAEYIGGWQRRKGFEWWRPFLFLATLVVSVEGLDPQFDRCIWQLARMFWAKLETGKKDDNG